VRVLIVDDEKPVAALVERFIKHLFDAETVVCHNAEETIVALKDSKFDKVLTDWNMPGGNGNLVIEAAKNAGIAVEDIVVMTGRVDENQEEAVSLGITTILEKPFAGGLASSLKEAFFQPA